MNDWKEMSADWAELRVRVSERWVKLSVEDLDHVAGDRGVLLGRLEERYGLSSEQADHAVTSFVERLAEHAASREKPSAELAGTTPA